MLTPLQKLPKNVGDLGKLTVAKGLNGCPKCNKSPNLVTLVGWLVGWLVGTCLNHFHRMHVL